MILQMAAGCIKRMAKKFFWLNPNILPGSWPEPRKRIWKQEKIKRVDKKTRYKNVCMEPQVLILSNKYDYASDYIASELGERNVPYLRLNNEDFPLMEITLSPVEPKLTGKYQKSHFAIRKDILKSIFFRRPVFLRDNYSPRLTPEDQLARSQWAAFCKGLTIFQGCKWINHPQMTYLAESKPYQLHLAHSIGFKIPRSIITNTDDHIKTFFPNDRDLAIKGLDSVLLKINLEFGKFYALNLNFTIC